MIRLVWAVCFLFALLPLASIRGEEQIVVKWKKAVGGGFENENRLPPGATVKIRVHRIAKNALLGVDFTVNSEKFLTKTEGDEFRAKVDKNGKVLVRAGANSADRISALEGTLDFGEFQDGNFKAYTLQLRVRVFD